jgi:hypothetical protein
MLSTSHKLIHSLVPKIMSVTRVISITMEMPITRAMLKNVYQSQGG